MKNRVLIVTGCGRDDVDIYINNGDVATRIVSNATLPSKQKYCKLHNYDLLSINDFGCDLDKNITDENIALLRVSRTADMLKYYDIVVWIDGDSIITNMNLKIEQFPLEPHCCFYASYDWNGKYSISAGNFIFTRGEYTEQFLHAFYDLHKTNNFPNEQTMFNYLYFNTNVRQVMKVLDHKYLNAAPSRSIYGDAWATRPDIPFPWDENSFLLHITGASNAKRMEILENNFKNYL